MGDESILFIVTTTQHFLVEDVKSGVRALQFIDCATEADLKLLLFDEHESSSETTFELITSAMSNFQNIIRGG